MDNEMKNTISVAEAREILKDTLEDAKVKYDAIGIEAGYEIKDYFGEDEHKTDKLIALFGLLSLKKNDEEVFLPLDVYLCDDDKIELDEIQDTVAKFNTFSDGFAEKLSLAEDKAQVMKELNDELEAEIAGETEKMNKSVSNTVKTAIIAAAVMLVLAGICVLVSALFR